MSKPHTEASSSGLLFTDGPNGEPIRLEWEKISPKTPRLTEVIKSLSPLLIKAYSEIETEFARERPNEVENDMFLKPLAPMIKENKDNLDWNNVKQQISQILSDFFTNMDWSMFSKPDDSHYFIVAIDPKTDTKLGMVQAILSPEHATGSVKVELYDGVFMQTSECYLQQILLDSIFKLIPHSNRIFFHTRITNLKGIAAHEKIGFSKFPSDLVNWVNLEMHKPSINKL